MRLTLLTMALLSGCAEDPPTPPALLDFGPQGRMDPALLACIATHLGKPADRVGAQDVPSLKHLDCIDEGISSIAGLDMFTELETLSLWENNINDVSALSPLTGLRWLELGNNDITDIRPLATLTNLERLSVSQNDVRSISAVASLPELEWLNLDGNRIEDASPIESLTQLRWLTIEHNALSDGTPIEAIASLGADVYHQNQRSSSARMSGGVVAPIDVDTATLSPRFSSTGEVDFDLMMADKLFPVRLEFSGTVRAEDGRLILSQAGAQTPIGHTDGATAWLCEAGEACSYALGVKLAPPEAYDGHRPEPVVTLALSVSPKPGPVDQDTYGQSDRTLIDYVLASPNQYDAGSCLFMTTTGALELLLHQHADLGDPTYDGDTDLSERFLMSAYQDVPSSTIRYWLTDTVYTYNHLGGSLLNRDYPFTAGYVRETASGSLVPCNAGDDGAYYSCSYNWFDERPEGWEAMMVDTPDVERTVAFTDPARSSSSQWNVGLMDDEDVEKIKYMLRTRRAPVVVIYNHYLYWHADLIVGYDDTISTGGCPMVESSMDHFNSEGAGGYTQRIEAHMEDIGPCTDKGVFYVRDSIYEGGSDELTYDYGPGFSEKYSKRIIERSYNWVKYLGNHAYSIHRQ